MIDFLSAMPEQLLLAVVAANLIAESGLLVGVFLPGASMALALGFLARHGVIEVWAAIGTVAVASVLGCQCGYFRGRRAVDSDSWLGRRVTARAGADRVRRTLSSLDRRAEPSIVVGQCFGVVRTLLPRLAGRAGVSHRRFTVCNVPAALGWAGLLVPLGYASGSAYEQVRTVVGLMGLPVVVAVVLVAWGVTWLRGRRTGRDAVRVSRR